LQAVDAAVKAAADATLERWKAERFRNDSSYMHMAALGADRCREIMRLLPGDAFADGNNRDLRIYAQAWPHGADMLVGPNRKTALRPVLKTHLERRGRAVPPVAVRGLCEHACTVAEQEDRRVEDVALDAVICAAVPDRWNPDMGPPGNSCDWLVCGFSTFAGSRNAGLSEDDELAMLLRASFDGLGLSAFVRPCEDAREKLPNRARQTEMRHLRRCARRFETPGSTCGRESAGRGSCDASSVG